MGHPKVAGTHPVIGPIAATTATRNGAYSN